jgi:hypothetical protein
MIIYRPHRGGLVESMKESEIFDDEDQLKNHIIKKWEGLISFEDIVINDDSVNDERIGWKDSRYVCTKRIGDKKFVHPQCIGQCATDFIMEENNNA